MKKCILCDIDGVLVDSSKWLPYVPANREDRVGWDVFAQVSDLCTPNKPMITIIGILGAMFPIIFVTSRENSDVLRKATERQLDEFSNGLLKVGDKHKLLMRPYADYRDPWQVKKDLIEAEVLPNYIPVLAVDDEIDNIVMYKSLGIKTWHYTKLRKK